MTREQMQDLVQRLEQGSYTFDDSQESTEEAAARATAAELRDLKALVLAMFAHLAESKGWE